MPCSFTYMTFSWSVVSNTDGWTDRQTEREAYEPTVQYAQLGPKRTISASFTMLVSIYAYFIQ